MRFPLLCKYKRKNALKILFFQQKKINLIFILLKNLNFYEFLRLQKKQVHDHHHNDLNRTKKYQIHHMSS